MGGPGLWAVQLSSAGWLVYNLLLSSPKSQTWRLASWKREEVTAEL